MQNLFLIMTLGNDPHIEGALKAGRIANMLNIPYKLLLPETSDEEKINIIKREEPVYLGLSYRLSPEKAIMELKMFLNKMAAANAFSSCSFICFAGLLSTLELVRKSRLDKEFHLDLMGSYDGIERTVGETIDFFRCVSRKKREEIIGIIVKENSPKRISILDQIAEDVIKDGDYFFEEPLSIPSKKAMKSLRWRIRESDIPVIRSHYGVPAETIEPTVEGIAKIAENRVVDEISLGSSDLSQRYYGKPEEFRNRKNDGGVPYKTKQDLERMFLASRCGNFPSIKPYCHVKDILQFIDECLSAGLLTGAHQAIPLFWFNELDGRGPMTVQESIDEHLAAVQYLAKKGIPVEMNDPNQWSSRMVHDTLFVVSYCLISAVMFEAGVQDMIFQCQFNKPATTGDYADLSKMKSAQYFVRELTPIGNKANVYYECRSGIEHFSPKLEKAKLQLARSTLLQMVIHPSVLHIVSYCEAVHAATADDVIESSKIVRRAVRLYKKNEEDILKDIEWGIVRERVAFLEQEVYKVLTELIDLSVRRKVTNIKEFSKYLSTSEVLKNAMKYRIMTAPGITNEKYVNPGLFTKAGEHGMIDCYRNWDDLFPMKETERIELLRREYKL